MSTETQLNESRIEAQRYETADSELARDYGIPSLAVIIPALNEAAGIFRTILELKQELQEFGGKSTYLVVDGHSTDETGHIAHRLGAVVLEQEGVGKGDAFRQALLHVPESSKYVVLMDADYTYPAEHIPEMVNLMESDPSIGMVSGNRFGNQRVTRTLQAKLLPWQPNPSISPRSRQWGKDAGSAVRVKGRQV